ncbi:hypothetical protein [Salipiger mangrovisoli]|uniref:Transposase n=1 Tax=Salipiger mangrovisoli TaxID=2865933 RepID=A0ABR9X0N8_9RHOB|nr:hypothetical protein [Salipiger mangrovisoli]MBE9637112.1 hypothetical protein [Salipiger mangrovisoli]
MCYLPLWHRDRRGADGRETSTQFGHAKPISWKILHSTLPALRAGRLAPGNIRAACAPEFRSAYEGLKNEIRKFEYKTGNRGATSNLNGTSRAGDLAPFARELAG